MNEDAIISERLQRLADETAYLKSERDALFRFEDYRNNTRLKKAVERSLQVAIEICFDIGQRIISVEGLRLANSYRETFLILQEAGILAPGQGERLANMASFRNLLVHDYVRIDDERVYVILKRRLGDFESFAAAIATYLAGR